MGVIRVLPPGLVNRIAAGECIERPASVVKELVENALDAGAARIDIRVEGGGRELIRVCDDGVGMDADDLRLCLSPHATSKLSNDDDLFNIQTMGFRGEALPSIASVSRLRITSCQRGQVGGHVVEADAGRIVGPAPAAAPPGTTVEVRELFYCVPARRRFLRTNQTEFGHVCEQVVRLGLAHVGVAFQLSHGARTALRLAATQDRRRRIADCVGPELAEALLPVERAGGGVRVEGLVAPPAESRGSPRWEYVFVNGRCVRDRFVAHAVREAYRSLIDPGRYPVAFIWITIDPSQIDVNVHPTKIEVRWRDSNFVHAQVLAALRERFLHSNLDRPLSVRSADAEAERARVRQAMVDYFTRVRPPDRGPYPVGAPAAVDPRSPDWPPAPRRAESPDLAPSAGSWSDAAADAGRVPQPPAGAPAAPVRGGVESEPEWSIGAPGAPPSPATEAWAGAPRVRALQVHNAYLVVETDDGLMIIDQHALHERVLYEQLSRRIAQQPLESQRLLIPEVIRVPPDRIEVLDAHADVLARLGLELRACGPDSVALYAYPPLLERVRAAEFARDLLDLLTELGAAPAPDALIHRVLDMIACKAAVKAGDALAPEEIEALLSARAASERASNCPHGRPTTLHLRLRDLERQFKRR